MLPFLGSMSSCTSPELGMIATKASEWPSGDLGGMIRPSMNSRKALGMLSFFMSNSMEVYKNEPERPNPWVFFESQYFVIAIKEFCIKPTSTSPTH